MSKRTLSNGERDQRLAPYDVAPDALPSVRAVGLDKLPYVRQDAERRGVPVVVVLAEGISDYLTALTLVEPAYPWQDAAQCVIGAVGCGQLVAAAEAAWGAVGAAGAHLVAVAHDDSGKADQGAHAAIDAVLRWRALGGISARLLACGDDLSADWRADDRGVLAAMDRACVERDGLDTVTMPGADIGYLTRV